MFFLLQEYEVGPFLPCAKSKSKWILDLNVRAKTTQILEEKDVDIHTSV